MKRTDEVNERADALISEFELHERAEHPVVTSSYRSAPRPIADVEADRVLAESERRRQIKRHLANGVAGALVAARLGLFAVASPGVALAFGGTVACTMAAAYAIYCQRRASSEDLFR